MTPRLRAILSAVGVLVFGGIGFQALVPKQGVKLADLRDAGVADGQRFVLECSERITPKVRTRIEAIQPGSLRPRQKYVRVARVAVCFNEDGGNCFRASDGLLRVGPDAGSVIVPGFNRRDPDSDDSDVVDEKECTYRACSRALPDAGFSNPYADGFCTDINRLAVQPPACVIPNGFRSDGGWCEESCGQVDCKFTGPYAQKDGGAAWRGFNAIPKQYAVGTKCIPVSCSLLFGDRTEDL